MTKYEHREKIKRSLRKYLILREECVRMREKIQEKRREMDWLREILTQISTDSNTDVLRQAENALEQINSMIGYYTKLTVQREAEERQVVDMLDSISNDTGRRILYLRYIEGHRFNDIPDELYISSRCMWYKYKDAIDELCALYDERSEENLFLDT